MQDQIIDGRLFGLTERQALLAIVTLAALLRFIGANAEFWFDEIVVVQHFVRVPAREIIQGYWSGNHVLYSLLANASAAVWGEQPWAVRLPAILFGIAGVWAFYFLARQLWSRLIALLGTLMFAVSYHHVHYTQNARGYTAFIFFALLATGLLLRLLQADTTTPTRWYGAAYACAIALGTYALVVMVFIIVGHACVLLVARRWRALSWLFAGTVFAMLLYVPMAHDFIAFYTQRPAETGFQLFSAGFIRELRPVIPLLLIGAVVTPLLLGRLVRRQPLAAALLFLPLILNIVVPTLRGQGVHPRAFIYGLPLAYFFLMEGMDWARLRFRWTTWVIVPAVIVVSLVMLGRYYQLPKQGFQQALSYITTHRGPTDDRIGLTLGGKAARFYDPSFVIIEDSEQMHQWLKTANNPTWILYTFENELRQTAPELHNWLMTATTHQATFPGVIGNGEVHVRLWLPNSGGRIGGLYKAGNSTASNDSKFR